MIGKALKERAFFRCRRCLAGIVAISLLALQGACAGGAGSAHAGLACEPGGGIPVLDYTLIRTLPHDPAAFTQGLLIADGWLYESTGLYGESSVRRHELQSGRELARTALPAGLFGEGLVLAQGRLYQLTWREGVVRSYRPEDLQLLASWRIDGEGWGLAFDGRHLIQSDGSATLFFRDPGDLREVRRLQVTAAGRPVRGLNELEYVGGRVFANLYPTDCVAVIDAAGGSVVGWLDLGGLARRAAAEAPGTDVTNGIAYDPAAGSYYVTGKYWPFLAEIRIDGLSVRPAADPR